MIPIQLSIQGMYSYQESMQTIDFKLLLEAGLFGIFGAVGSGKSSILEAITIALYGESERLNKSGDDRNYNMMNLRSEQMLVDFVFKNFEDKKYRFIYKTRRNSRNYNEVRSPERLAYVWSQDEWESLDHTNGEIVTGLSYANFKRTVIIPQGRFQEFLNLTPSHRSEMLKDLFYLDQYDLSYSTNQLKSENNEAIHRIEGRLTGYESIVPEALTNCETKIALLENEVMQSSGEFQKIKAELESMQKLQQLHIEREIKQAASKVLEEKEPNIRTAEKILKQFIEAERVFFHLINRQKEQEGTLKKFQLAVEEMVKEEQVLVKKKTTIEEEYKALQNLLSMQEERRRKAEHAKVAAQLLTTNSELEKKKKRITDGNSAIEDVKSKIKRGQEKLDVLENSIEEIRKSSLNRELLIELRNQFRQKEEIQKQILSLTNHIENTKKAFEQHTLGFLKKVGMEDGLLDPNRVEVILDQRRSRIESEIEKKQRAWSHHQVQERLAKYVDELEQGKPCPLCGSVEHPAPTSFDENSDIKVNFQFQIKSMEQERQELDRNKIEWEQIGRDEKKMNQDEKRFREDQVSLNEKLQQIIVFLEDHQEEYPTIATVEEALTASEKILSNLASKQEELKAERKEVSTLQLNLEKYREKVGQIKSECDQLQGQISSQESLLTAEAREQVHNYSAKEWRALSEKIFLEIQLEKEKQMKLSGLRDDMIRKYSQLESNLKTTTELLEKEKEDLRLTENQLHQSLVSSSFENLEEVRTVLGRDMDVGQEEHRIREHDRQVHVLKEVLRDLNQKMNGRDFDAEAYDNMKQAYEVQEKKLVRLREEKNFEIKRLEDLRKKWDEKQGLAKERASLKMRSESLDTLSFLFRGKGFVNYVSTVYLREITEIANRRFRLLTHNHFALVLTEDNQFSVRDYLNDGQLRSVKTLSGGQTFQVSLCLALALAESLQSRTKGNQNFFFLDEGFGTLDKEAMELVFESLKSLQKEGRVVGVISHVEALQEEIERHLLIVNDAEKGSQILEKWKG